MELRLPLEMSPGREAACRAVFGTWGFLSQSSVFLYLNWKYHYELMRFSVCVHMYGLPHPTPRLESLKWTETVTDSVAMNIPSDQTGLLNYFSLKEPQDFLEKLLTPSLVQEIKKKNLYDNCLT